MGNETIFYYVTEEFITGCKRVEKTLFWRKIKLPSFVAEEDNITIVTIMIPDLKKGWNREKLLKKMQEAAEEHPMDTEGAQTLVQPDVQRMLTGQEAAESAGGKAQGAKREAADMSGSRSAYVSVTEWRMAEKILGKSFGGKPLHTFPEAVVLLLGDTMFPEEQMQKFMEMMLPYFPRINRLLILYPAEGEADGEKEVEESREDSGEETQEANRWEEAVLEYIEEIYYEYGLVAQTQPGNLPLKQHSIRTMQEKAFFLDFGYPETLPVRAARAGDFYLDIFSSETKMALFRKKYMENSYSSPLKYLDTMVKSGYDKLVHQVLGKKKDNE